LKAAAVAAKMQQNFLENLLLFASSVCSKVSHPTDMTRTKFQINYRNLNVKLKLYMFLQKPQLFKKLHFVPQNYSKKLLSKNVI
jgi:hypothetical protein